MNNFFAIILTFLVIVGVVVFGTYIYVGVFA